MTPFCTRFSFSNSAQRALHFRSARCSSRSSELLKVSRADMPYSCISASTRCGCASPKPVRPPPPDAVGRCTVDRTDLAPVVKIFPVFTEQRQKHTVQFIKLTTVPEDDNMPCRVRAVPLLCVFLISVSFSFPAAAFALHPKIFLPV